MKNIVTSTIQKGGEQMTLADRRKTYHETYREVYCENELEADLTCSDLVADGFEKGTAKGHEHEYTLYYDDTEHVARIAVFVVDDHGTAAYVSR